jgi:carboxylesterase type B
MLLSSSLAIIAGLSILLHAASIPDSNIVDLGYARHRPRYMNATKSGLNVLSYMNIRFAQPPTGPLRFKNPVVPPHYTAGIQDGAYPPLFTDCISAAPPEVPFPDINGTAWGHEDCLFLNVLVPEGVEAGDKLPVLHWITGSAYSFGGKDSFVSPLGLLDGIKNNPNETFIFVASNYRSGLPDI